VTVPIVVWPVRNVLGWSEDDPSGPAFPVVDASTAMRRPYATDAHFVPYHLTGEDRCPRLLKDTPADYPIAFSLIPLDCEPEGHKPDDAWHELAQGAARELGWAYYRTRGGCRILFALATPTDRAGFCTIQKRAALALGELGVRVDPATLDQWGRCYRLPFVNRDGVPQRLPAHGLGQLPLVDVDTLPSLIGVDPSRFGGVAAAELGWRNMGNVGEGGRNGFLMRAAGGLRRAGLGGAALLEELANVNESRCNPPLPMREVAALARSAERYEPGAALARQLDQMDADAVEDSQPLALGSEVEVARRVLDEFTSDTIGDQGMLWVYNAELGVWESHDGTELARRADRFDGMPIAAGNDRDGNPQFRPLKVSAKFSEGAAKVALRRYRMQRYFDHEAPGVAFANGFYDPHKGELVPHCPDHRARMAVPFDYTPNAEPKAFIAFLRGVWRDQPDASQLCELVRQIIGVMACGAATSIQKAFILLGSGSNGKSVLLDVIRSLFPPEACTAISPQEWGDEYRRARLSSSRINLVSELPEVELLSSEKVKGIISGDVTEGRAIYSAPYDYTPKAGHVFAANSLPGVRDHSHGFWRRWGIIPFTRTFAVHEQDRGLTKRLVETQRGLILSWAVDAVAGVLDGGYIDPPSCQEALRRWQSSADQIACFLGEAENINGQDHQASMLYQQYVNWARQNGHKQLSNRIFGERLNSRRDVNRVKRRAGWFYLIG
jgi:P4 family phage/plasmid primase-like protien